MLHSSTCTNRGANHIPPHRDVTHGNEFPIVSFSFYQDGEHTEDADLRVLMISKSATSAAAHTLTMRHGSALVMHVGMQQRFLHWVPPSASKKWRINVTLVGGARQKKKQCSTRMAQAFARWVALPLGVLDMVFQYSSRPETAGALASVCRTWWNKFDQHGCGLRSGFCLPPIPSRCGAGACTVWVPPTPTPTLIRCMRWTRSLTITTSVPELLPPTPALLHVHVTEPLTKFRGSSDRVMQCLAKLFPPGPSSASEQSVTWWNANEVDCAKLADFLQTRPSLHVSISLRVYVRSPFESAWGRDWDAFDDIPAGVLLNEHALTGCRVVFLEPRNIEASPMAAQRSNVFWNPVVCPHFPQGL